MLLVRSIYGATKGRFLLPAGNVNAGELPDTAAARETFEETNLRVEIEGLLGVRIWVRDDGEHNYFFMFRAKLRSPLSDLQPNINEIDDARFFSKEEMDALSTDETWAGIDNTLRKGRRGLPGGSSLAKLLDKHRRHR